MATYDPAIDAPQELVNFLATEAENAKDHTLDGKRAAFIDAYFGALYGDEQEGRSQAVTRDVSEVVDFMCTGILGTIMAGGKAVEFETEPDQIPAVGPDGQPQTDQSGQPVMQEVDYGAQATKSVQYQFFRKQKGYRILHDAVKASLIEMTGVVRTYAEQRRPLQQQVQAPAALIDGDETNPTLGGHRVVSAEPADDPEHDAATQAAIMNPGLAAPSPAMRLHTITIEVPQSPLIRDEAIPNEWFLCSPDTVDLDDSPYVGQCTPTTISQLVGMGFDPERLKTIWDNAPAETVVSQARDADRGKSRQNIGNRTGAARQLWLYTEYPLWDLNGDGIAERLCVIRIGREVLSITEVDEQPYSGGSPIPMQFRFAGQGMADKTADIQRIRTVLLRSALNSLYLSVMPRMLVPEEGISENTIDDLLTPNPGALIRYKGGAAPAPLTVQDTSATAFQAMEMMSAERDGRTGVTRQSQGQNPDTTNKTASGMAMLQQNADQIELYVTRNLVEAIVAPMFAKRYRLMKAVGEKFRMKIDGKYQPIDPTQWPDEPDVAINVGLGTGTKDQRIAYRDKLLNYAATAVQGGLRIFGESQIHAMVQDQAEDMGFSYPARYVLDPAQLPPPEPKPDPEVAKAQADAQTQQARDQQSHQQTLVQLQLQEQQQQADAALKAQANDADLQAKREKAALDTDLAHQKAIAEAALAERQQSFQEQMAIRQQSFNEQMAARKASQVDSPDGVSKFRDGGSLAE